MSTNIIHYPDREVKPKNYVSPMRDEPTAAEQYETGWMPSTPDGLRTCGRGRAKGIAAVFRWR
jgi:hypothetical protein